MGSIRIAYPWVPESSPWRLRFRGRKRTEICLWAGFAFCSLEHRTSGLRPLSYPTIDKVDLLETQRDALERLEFCHYQVYAHANTQMLVFVSHVPRYSYNSALLLSDTMGPFPKLVRSHMLRFGGVSAPSDSDFQHAADGCTRIGDAKPKEIGEKYICHALLMLSESCSD